MPTGERFFVFLIVGVAVALVSASPVERPQERREERREERRNDLGKVEQRESIDRTQRRETGTDRSLSRDLQEGRKDIERRDLEKQQKSAEVNAETRTATAEANSQLPFENSAQARRVSEALERVDSGSKKYDRDGIEFQNREGRLPSKESGYYREYTVEPAEGIKNRGAERLVAGKDGEVYYTPDHYGTFVRIR